MGYRIVKQYDLNQCSLYRTGSLKKLAENLEVSYSDLIAQSNDPSFGLKEDNGKIFYPPIRKLRKIHDRVFSLLKHVNTPDYLNSDKKGCSNVLNAGEHNPNHSLIKTDIKNYFPSVSSKKLYLFFTKKLQISSSVANCLCKLLCKDGRLVKGSPASGLLAFWSNIDMFNKINNICSEQGFIFTLYVADISISSSDFHPSILRRVNGIIRQNGYSHHKHRVYRPSQEKVVTGVVLGNNKYRPSKSTLLKKQRDFSLSTNNGVKSYESYVHTLNK